MSVPIADYALLSDRHTAALVSRTGSVDWLCAPRFDSPSLFGRLLDRGAGHFSLRPLDAAADVERRYVDETMVLETTWTTATGTLVALDALATGDGGGDPHTLGANAPRALIRALECTAGQVEVAVEFAPRPEYGLVQPLLAAVPGGVMMRGGADVLALSCPVPLAADSRAATGTLVLRAGEHATLGLTHRTTSEPYPAPLPGTELDEALRVTVDAWRAWSRIHQGYQGPWRDLVHHSGRVLQALSYQPTGAVVAAPTTSLPEEVGGERNWDYRYSWVRDASFTLEALWVAACPDEAHQFFDYLAVSSAGEVRGGRDLQIMFGVGGEHDLTERELGHLAGWRRQPPRAGGQRCLEPAPGRRLRGAARRGPPARGAAEPGPSRRDGMAGVPRCVRGRGHAALARHGPGDLGGPRRAPAFRVLEAHVLGGAGPGRCHGRHAAGHRPRCRVACGRR